MPVFTAHCGLARAAPWQADMPLSTTIVPASPSLILLHLFPLFPPYSCRRSCAVAGLRQEHAVMGPSAREELRAVPRHPKYKTEPPHLSGFFKVASAAPKTFHQTGTYDALCRSYASSGFCAYGARCRFIHSRPNPLPSPSFPGFDWTSVLSSSASSPGRLNFLGDSPAQVGVA
eukprot:scaffold288471_cov19-Tisochrysis_lutea.AAC.1